MKRPHKVTVQASAFWYEQCPFEADEGGEQPLPLSDEDFLRAPYEAPDNASPEDLDRDHSADGHIRRYVIVADTGARAEIEVRWDGFSEGIASEFGSFDQSASVTWSSEDLCSQEDKGLPRALLEESKVRWRALMQPVVDGFAGWRLGREQSWLNMTLDADLFDGTLNGIPAATARTLGSDLRDFLVWALQRAPGRARTMAR